MLITSQQADKILDELEISRPHWAWVGRALQERTLDDLRLEGETSFREFASSPDRILEILLSCSKLPAVEFLPKLNSVCSELRVVDPRQQRAQKRELLVRVIALLEQFDKTLTTEDIESALRLATATKRLKKPSEATGVEILSEVLT